MFRICSFILQAYCYNRGCFFHQNFTASVPKSWGFQISDTRVHIFFTRILQHPYQNSGGFQISETRAHIFFHQNFTASAPKFWGFQISDTRVHIFFHQELTVSLMGVSNFIYILVFHIFNFKFFFDDVSTVLSALLTVIRLLYDLNRNVLTLPP